MTQYFELACSMNKKGAYRVIRNATTKKEVQEFVKQNPNENLYMSVYTFNELTNGIPFYESAVCDKIFIEFDNEGHGLINEVVWQDLRKLLNWCTEEEKLSGETLRPQVYFSGGSGYHIIFQLEAPVKELHNNKVVQRVGEKLKYLSGCKLIDLQANKGFTQLRRIPNTQNHKSGFYCIPLTIDEAYNLEPNAILKLAQHPRKIKNDIGESSYFTNVIKHIHHSMIQAEVLNKQEPTKYHEIKNYILDNNLQRIRPCIFRLMQQSRLDFEQSTWVACEMIRCNYDDGRIHDFFKKLRGDKYNYEMTRYQLKKIREKKLWAPSCRYLREKGYCNDEYHRWAGEKKYDGE